MYSYSKYVVYLKFALIYLGMRIWFLLFIHMFLLMACGSSNSVSENLSSSNENVEQENEKLEEQKLTLLKAIELNDSSTVLIEYIKTLKEDLINQSEATPKNKRIVEQIMLGDKGKELERKMDVYINFANSLSIKQRAYFTQLEGGDNSKEKLFLEEKFAEKTLVECLDILTEYQNKIAIIESEIMHELTGKVDSTYTFGTVKIKMH